MLHQKKSDSIFPNYIISFGENQNAYSTLLNNRFKNK